MSAVTAAALTTASVPSHRTDDSEKSSTLLELPKELLGNICGFFGFKDGANFMATCKQLKNKYWDSLFTTHLKTETLSLGAILNRAAKEIHQQQKMNRMLKNENTGLKTIANQSINMSLQLQRRIQAQEQEIEDLQLEIQTLEVLVDEDEENFATPLHSPLPTPPPSPRIQAQQEEESDDEGMFSTPSSSPPSSPRHQTTN